MNVTKDMLDSGIFTFVVGEEQKSFLVHEAVVSAESDVFRNMIQSEGFKESKDRIATMQEVDAETFAHFMEYLYTGNYYLTPIPDAVIQGTVSIVRWSFRNSVDVSFIDSRSEAYWKKFESMEFSIDGTGHEDLRVSLTNSLRKDFISDDLIIHAKLYCFARMYFVKDLKTLCLFKLHQDLMRFELKDDTAEKLIDLLRYTYNNTSNIDDTTVRVGSRLRKLVIYYVAGRATKLMNNTFFLDLLEGGGEWAVDFFRFLLQKSGLRENEEDEIEEEEEDGIGDEEEDEEGEEDEDYDDGYR